MFSMKDIIDNPGSVSKQVYPYIWNLYVPIETYPLLVDTVRSRSKI